MADIETLPPEAFPSLLREIPDAPTVLYLRGTLPPKDHKLVAVVGSRRMTRYGKEAVDYLVRGLSGYPITVVSGLALGVDGAAHRAALSAGLKTLAIPGSGLSDSVLYPATHRSLAKEILAAGGALLSEEEPGFRARPESFPKRNRLMAGMSHATLIIEATIQSGTLITAKLASEYNRELLVVSHGIFSESGAGGHVFIKLGATPVRSASDILEALGMEEAKHVSDLALSESEQQVLDALTEPIQRDELLRTLRLATAEGNALLLSMELKGYVSETLGLIRKNV